MTKEEKALAALKAKGVNTTATKWETISVKLTENDLNPDDFSDDPMVSDLLIKIITESGGKSFENAKKDVQADIEKEFPDFGREIPEGVYTLTGYCTIHDWVSKDGRVSHIRTAYLDQINPATGQPFELPFAALSANEFPFVPADGTGEFQPKCVLKHFDSPNRRNLAVLELGKGFKVKVRHARGHHKNPYAKRVFDFLYTWAEKV